MDHEPLAGWWVAADGKAVLIEHVDDQLLITVAPTRDAPAYRSAELLGGGHADIRRLPAEVGGTDDVPFLQVEAGTPGLGPTYRLHVVTEPAGDVLLVPNVGMGLYDDYDDDLGVPWAFPLLPLRLAQRQSDHRSTD
jgi:hypothetical protein